MRGLRALVAALALAVGAWGAEAQVARVAAIGLTVADADRSLAFYRDVLGFAVVQDVEVSGAAYEALYDVFPVRMRVVRLRLGREELELTEYLTPRGRPAPGDARSNDLWFQHVAIVVRDMDAAYAALRVHRVTHISPEPQRLPDGNPQAGGIRAFYFRDPDGHALELIWFPPDKGVARWHEPTTRHFLGIDHTAIAVDDTETSLGFYRDRLGMRVVGRSENRGPEQERLSAVRGAHLRITTLRAVDGPGIELLEYVTPDTGRPYPADARANDLVHCQTRLIAEDAEALDALGSTVGIPGAPTGFDQALGLRDPDGHHVEVVTP